ncbi:MAG TPA: DUF3108 domain-containing protein [Dehalococcoidia bacterium]|nr:DUF3108 domain-containing protein [Dehalococcoidia bacterium]
MPFPLRPAAALFCLVFLAAACRSTDSGVVTEDIVSQVPFPEEAESATYELTDDDGDPEGSGTLSATRSGTGFLLVQDFGDEDGNSDCWEVEVDEQLKPLEVFRVIVQVDDGEEDSVELSATYSEDTVSNVFAADGESREDEADLPRNHYDSLTEVFLLRTLDFVENEEYAFNSVFTARPDGRDIADDATIFEIEGQETIEVPAGEYDTWRIGIRGGFGADRTAWINVDEPHELVRFDFGFLVYALTDYSAEVQDGPSTCTG